MARGGPSQNEATKNMMKKLMGDVKATLLFSGVQLHQNGLFGGISGSQLSSRIQMIELHPFSAGSPQTRERFEATLDHWEQGLPLNGNEPGTLRSLAPYLFNRTGGVMGELANVLRTAGVVLIHTGAWGKYGREQLTEALFEQIPLGAAAVQRKIDRTDDDELDWPLWPEAAVERP